MSLRHRLALAVVLLSSPALAQVPTTGAGSGNTGTTTGGPLSAPTKLGTCYSVAAAPTCVVTVTNDCVAGSTIWVAAANRATIVILSMADSQSNSYTLETAVTVPTSNFDMRSGHAYNTAHSLIAANSDTITVTFNSSATNQKYGAAYCVANNGGTFADDTVTTGTGSATPYVVPSPSYAITANVIAAGIATVTATSFPSGLPSGTVVQVAGVNPSTQNGQYTLNATSGSGSFTATTSATGTYVSGGSVDQTTVTLNANAIGFVFFFASSATTWTYAPTSPLTAWTRLDQINSSAVLTTFYTLLPTLSTSFGFTSGSCITSCPPSVNFAGEMKSFHD